MKNEYFMNILFIRLHNLGNNTTDNDKKNVYQCNSKRRLDLWLFVAHFTK